jgi:O-acetyl-ADP-ribose deacetylase (regulator of RNase III)
VKERKAFEAWASKILDKYVEVLSLQAWNKYELRYYDDMGDALLTVATNYPYRWITIKYGASVLKLFADKKEHNDLRHALLHEMVHVVLDELKTKAQTRSTSSEISDSLETTVEHFTVVIGRLINE